MKTLLLFVLFPLFTPQSVLPTQSTASIPQKVITEETVTKNIQKNTGNLLSSGLSCRVDSQKLMGEYKDATIKNSLSSENGIRSFPIFLHAFPENFLQKETQEKILAFLTENNAKCSDFLISMVKYDSESNNWIFEIVDLRDFSYKIFLNSTLVASFPTYVNNEWLAFQTEFSHDKNHIITRVGSREADASKNTEIINQRIAKYRGIYRDNTKISDDLEKIPEELTK